MIRLFTDITESDLHRVGGKGLNLGALARAGFPVPPGLCVTTDAFRLFLAGCPELPALYVALDALDPGDVEAARRLGEHIRGALSALPLPDAVIAPLVATWQGLGAAHAYAVRSSATAEDLPSASFAGQQDTYLNVRGQDALLDMVRRCFVSLFTDRAILYRARGRFGHRGVALSVVVQRMVFPEAAGILFTADPVSGHRGTLSIDAGFGLGEALVSGLVNADLYRVDRRSGALREIRVGDKALAIVPRPEGGTEQIALPETQRRARVLDDAQVAALVRLGLAVEAHYQRAPQDIEWGIADGQLYLLQARPITSLYPLIRPLPREDAVHVYFSFSHVQNMTDPISPLGRDVLRILLPLGKSHLMDTSQDSETLVEAGSRLFVDVTRPLRVGPLRRLLLGLLGRVYPDIAQGIALLAERPEVRAAAPPSFAAVRPLLALLHRLPPALLSHILLGRPEGVSEWADQRVEQIVDVFRAEVEAAAPGPARLAAVRRALVRVFPKAIRLPPAIAAGILSLGWLRARFRGTPEEADVEALQRGLYGNITTEMDLQVGDLADMARPHPELVLALRRGVPDRAALQGLTALPGGAEFVAALERFLSRFGMRGQAEIDIARPRWLDQPGLLLATVAGNLSGEQGGSHRAHFHRLRQEGDAAGERLVAAAGWLSRRWVRRLVRVVRHGLGVREHPKYLLVRCLGLAREVILDAARDLVAKGRLDTPDDVFFLRMDELERELGGMDEADPRPVVLARRAELERDRHRHPPMVVTSEGETPLLARARELPPGALGGLGASAGLVEGVARVILDPAKDVLQAGEILVAPYTDPGWTPLFVHAAGLVCDVGGMMTHGSVVAREYGIPAVVGVAEGTRRIRTGQRVRVDGTRGVVELLVDQKVPASPMVGPMSARSAPAWRSSRRERR